MLQRSAQKLIKTPKMRFYKYYLYEMEYLKPRVKCNQTVTIQTKFIELLKVKLKQKFKDIAKNQH